jgi:hypothetical protein
MQNGSTPITIGRILYAPDTFAACAGYLLIRPELSGKRGLSCYFTFNNFQEQHDGQNPSLVTRAHQILDKTRHIGVFLGIGVQIIISNFCYYDTASGK